MPLNPETKAGLDLVISDLHKEIEHLRTYLWAFDVILARSWLSWLHPMVKRHQAEVEAMIERRRQFANEAQDIRNRIRKL